MSSTIWSTASGVPARRRLSPNASQKDSADGQNFGYRIHPSQLTFMLNLNLVGAHEIRRVFVMVEVRQRVKLLGKYQNKG